MFHDVRIRGSHQLLAPAIHALGRGSRKDKRARTRESSSRGRRRGSRSRSSSLRGQEVVSVGSGHRPRRSLLVPAHTVSDRGLLTTTALGVEALGS